MDHREQFLSPDAASGHSHYQQNHQNHHSHHHRTRSFKARSRAKESDDVYERPRRNSMPSHCRQHLSSSYNDLLEKDNSDNDESLRRVRSFKMTSKGVVNRGDSYKKKPQRERNLSSVGLIMTDENTDPATNGHVIETLRTDKVAIRIKTDDVDNRPMPDNFTVVVLGPPGVGKASLTSQFMTSEFIGVSDNTYRDGEKTISVLLDGEESTLNFVDPVIDEVDFEETPIDAFIVVFSTNDRSSFDVAADTLHQLRHEFVTNKAIILVANKIDLVRKRQVTADEGRAVASQFDCKYAETSAALNHHVDELLVGILSQIRLQNDPEAVEYHEHHKRPKERKGSFSVAKGLLTKLFRKGSKRDKSCDNLYEL
ncbi:hypothetical protein FSP39_012996 [Pinctada imbricata]|uniref:Uncharacterized protein n=1 Tax=Pinctada imbricata TaxID=66713 RepID=A0AA89BP51_PINIB|nr:hypothetical protein FSP39_012996 [Pinctada imbricata]